MRSEGVGALESAQGTKGSRAFAGQIRRKRGEHTTDKREEEYFNTLVQNQKDADR